MDSTPSRPMSQLIAGIESPSTAQLIAGIQSPSAPSIHFGRSTLRRSIRPHQPPTHDVETDELRVQFNTLQYELENIKQERDLESLRHEKETRELQLKSDADFRKAQTAEASCHRANTKCEALAKEFQELQDSVLNEKAELERKARSLKDDKLTLEEDLEEFKTQMADQERHFQYQIKELEGLRASLQSTLEDVQRELDECQNSHQRVQEKLCEREAQFEEIEAQNIRLRAEGNDAEASKILKHHISEQVRHIRELEIKNRDQVSELRHLRQVQKNVEVVEEQKRSLENQLQLMSELESENNTLHIQKQMLEDERQSWASLLQDNAADFDSPEEVVKGLLEERIKIATLVDQIGTLEAKFLEHEEIIKGLENEKTHLLQEIEQLHTGSNSATSTSTADRRANSRLERQRVLAVKEVEYLRAQLNTFDEEEQALNTDTSQFDQKKADQICQLQTIVDEYRNEVNSLHEELSRLEVPPKSTESEHQGAKRPLSPTDSNERLAILTRKNRKLQDAYTKSEQHKTLARKELEAVKSQLKALKARSSTRVLELKGNPTAEVEKVKMTTLRTLQAENRDLLTQLRGNNTEVSLVKKVPASALESLKLEMQEMERVVADKEKRNTRLREIYAAKAIEFREAVASLLGYKLDILPNGRVRVTSMFHLSPEYRHGDPSASSSSGGPGSMGNGEENSILFDGQNGSMKLSGGNNSVFAMEIRPLLKFWVQERKDIPCFLAAMTLDFYDKTTRAARM